MFSHLDDQAGYQPDASFRQAVLSGGRRRLRRRRLAVSSATAVVALVAVMAGLVGYLNWKTGQIRRVDVGAALAPKAAADAPYNVLLVGTDHGTNPSLGPRDVVDVQADVIILVRIDEAGDAVKFLPIPRDLWVGSNDLLRATFSRGGPEAVVQAVTATLQVPVAHYVQIDLDGLRDLVDAVGGVRITSPQALSDPTSGLSLNAACNTLDGRQAVALSRSRHLTGGGDLDRIEIDRALAVALLQTFQRMSADPASINHLLDVLIAHLTVDSSWPRTDLLDVARFLHGLELNRIEQDGFQLIPDQRGGGEGLRFDRRTDLLVPFGGPPPPRLHTEELYRYATGSSLGITAC